MTVFRDEIDACDEEKLAELHLAMLPRSMVSQMGLKYARTFYRYMARSDQELLYLLRGKSRAVLAASVITLDPLGIERRLLLRTPLLFWAALQPWKLPFRDLVHDL